jgi:hypothetical protein
MFPRLAALSGGGRDEDPEILARRMERDRVLARRKYLGSHVQLFDTSDPDQAAQWAELNHRRSEGVAAGLFELHFLDRQMVKKKDGKFSVIVYAEWSEYTIELGAVPEVPSTGEASSFADLDPSERPADRLPAEYSHVPA